MKKLAFALMFALPFALASCSNDKEDENSDGDGDTPAVAVKFTAPAQAWGKTISEVKTAVAAQKLGLILYEEGDDELWYVTGKEILEEEMQLPWYIYDFNGNGLEIADYYVDRDQKADFEAWLGKEYHKYPALEGEDWLTFGNTVNEEDCTLYVYCEDWSPVDEETGDVLYDFTVGEWEPYTDADAKVVRTRGISKREVAAQKHISNRQLRKVRK